MTDMDHLINIGVELERAGKEAEAIEHFRQLVEQYPDNARVIFEFAGAYDFAGQEPEAVPLYRRAMALGLTGEDERRVYVQFGSTLRNVKAYDEAIALFDEGIQRFPDWPSLRVFRAYALESAGRQKEAITELLELAIEHIQTPDMVQYKRAIRFYTDDRK